MPLEEFKKLWDFLRSPKNEGVKRPAIQTEDYPLDLARNRQKKL